MNAIDNGNSLYALIAEGCWWCLGKVLEFARGLVSADYSAILDVNYTVNGSPSIQRDMHQVHSKRNPIHCIHCLVRLQRRRFYKGAILSKRPILQF